MRRVWRDAGPHRWTPRHPRASRRRGDALGLRPARGRAVRRPVHRRRPRHDPRGPWCGSSPSPGQPSTRWGGSTDGRPARSPTFHLPIGARAVAHRGRRKARSGPGDPRQARRVLPWLRRGNSGRRRPDPSLRPGRLGSRVLPDVRHLPPAADAVSPRWVLTVDGARMPLNPVCPRRRATSSR